MATIIHPSAIIAKGAQIEDGAHIGPYCVIGEDVKIAKDVNLMSHVVVDGDSSIDEGTVVFPFATIGLVPQDLKFAGEQTKIVIGKNNKIREHVTIHLATKDGTGVTKVGDNCLLMVGSHLAHDVSVGNNVIIANNVLLAGHVTIEDSVIVGGGSAVHQFCRIGEHAFIGGLSGVVGDIVPYALYTGIREEGEINGINMVGLKRKGYSLEDIHAIKKCYDTVFDRTNPFKENVAKALDMYKNNDKVKKVLDFITSEKSRSLCHNYRNAK